MALDALSTVGFVLCCTALPLWLSEWLRLRHASETGVAAESHPSAANFPSAGERLAVRGVGLLALALWYVTLAYLASVAPMSGTGIFWDALLAYWPLPLGLALAFLLAGLRPPPGSTDTDRIGHWLLGIAFRNPVPAPGRTLWLGLAIKAFFIPLMFAGAFFFAGLWLDAASQPASAVALVLSLISLMYLMDTILSLIGYLSTSRRLDAHIRSCEPTVFGWVVALICYAPFFNWLNFWGLDFRDGYGWYDWLTPGMPLFWIWAAGILASTGIYAWSTLAFGIRFSNLTHRGIITHGPYRWSKHPAYLAKNLSFWLVAVPFISPYGPTAALHGCLSLLAVNLIYLLRARTEERHLSRDPVYVAYAEWIARHGLLARVRRALAGLHPARARR